MVNLKHKAGIIIAALLTLSALSACGVKKVDKRAKDKEKSINQQGQVNDAGISGEKKPVKLNWYLHASWYNKQWDPKNTLYDKIVTEKTGVDLNIIVPSSEEDEKLIAMTVSGNLPDIMTISNWSGVRGQMIKSGYFQPLNKLAEKYAPEFLNIVPESMQKWNTQADGNWYAISNFYTGPEWLPKGTNIENENGIIARRDIMNKLGIKPEDFLTEDGTVEALKKVKNANLTYNGKKIIPFYFEWNDWAMARLWGIPWEAPDGNWIDYKLHPNYLDMYKFLNRLWREGLISEENFTMWAGEPIEQGLTFAYMGGFGQVSDAMTKAYAMDNKMVYVPVGPIHALNGAEPLYDQAGTGWMSTFITKDCKYPDKAIKLLSYLSSDEGQMLTWFGVEGRTYKLVNDKAYYMSEYANMKREDPELAKKIYGFDDFWPLQQPLFKQRFRDKKLLLPDEKNYNNIVDFFSQFSVNTPETMYAWPEQGTAEAGIADRINSYWSEVTRKMVLAGSPGEVESIYRQAINYIKDLGYQKVYDASNAIFQAQKTKMGKKFSYPGNEK